MFNNVQGEKIDGLTWGDLVSIEKFNDLPHLPANELYDH
jgi:hypothetical protein